MKVNRDILSIIATVLVLLLPGSLHCKENPEVTRGPYTCDTKEGGKN